MSSQLSVLVADDDEFVRSILERRLRSLGCRVGTAADGDAARAILAGSDRWDVVICDLKMPGADGVELLRDLARLQPSAGLILMSGTDPRVLQAACDLADARRLRVLGALRKPISTAALQELLDRVDVASAPAVGAPVAEIEAEHLRQALAGGEIEAYVQPQLRLQDGRLVAVEALARWVQSDGRVVPPDAFIRVAEDSGLMAELTFAVMRRAFDAWVGWREAGLHLRLSFNVPVSMLDRLNLADEILEEVRLRGLRPQDLTLELTESGLMRDTVGPLDVLTRLRLRGMQLAIDDFGTGYSSLQQLQRLPFSELKIDRSFVAAAADSAGARSIVESSIRLAQQLGLTTVAEGVETQADWDLLQRLGCDLAQGYFVSPALPRRELPDWAKRRGLI